MERQITPETYGLRDGVERLSALADDKLLISLALAVGILSLRWSLIRLLRRWARPDPTPARLGWISIVRNGGLLALFALLILLWLPEIEAFALSITAFALAVVVASKELILCLSGGLLRSTSGAFTTGDWIEVAGNSGEVAEQTLLSTTLWEFDDGEQQFTGRQVTLPNSLFLAHPVVNHGFRKRFVFHNFTIHSEPIPGAEAAREAIEAGLRAASADFADLAQRYASMIETRSGVRLPSAAPRVRIRTTEFAKLGFETILFCPRDRALDMEAAATRAFLDWAEAQPWRFAGTTPRTRV